MLDRFLAWLFRWFFNPPQLRLGRLALAFIVLGGFFGYSVCSAAITRAQRGMDDGPDDYVTLLLFVVAATFLAQVPIGHGLACERAWAVIAAYWTLGVLFGYACLGFAVNRYFQRPCVPLPTVPFVYSVVCYFVLRSTNLAQSIAAQRRRRIDRSSLLD